MMPEWASAPGWRWTWRARLFAAAAAIAGATSADGADATPRVRIVGSDLLGIEFSKSLYAFGARESVPLSLAFDGSRPAVARLARGTAEVGLLVLPDAEFAPLSGLETHTIGYHRVVVLAPAECPLSEISLAQLAEIFGDGSATRSVRWGDLGATGDWAAAVVRPVAPEIGAGLALEYFRQVVLGGGALKAGMERFRSAQELAKQFSPGARCLVIAAGAPPDLRGAKLLALSGPSGPAIAPTATELAAGRYPLGLPLRTVVARERSAETAKVLRFLSSDEATRALEQAGLVALSAERR